MLPQILLVNPPIYDFAAYDFWLKPYGLLTAAGYLRSQAEFKLFDYLDHCYPSIASCAKVACDKWGRGRYPFEIIPTPGALKDIPRHFRRFGLGRELFISFLKQNRPADFVLIQTMMTYWYPAVREVIEDVRRHLPEAKIILGGNYVTLCGEHTRTLEADLLIEGTDLQPLWEYLGIGPDLNQPALWEAYEKLDTAVIKLSDGCPFKCTYCSVPKVYQQFKARPLEHSLTELELLLKLGAKNIAFYDDALLFKADETLAPFLNEVIKRKMQINFHTPNALNARFITDELAALMLKAGFKTFYLGFESASAKWQEKTGSKVLSKELSKAVRFLTDAGADSQSITAYQILGYPHSDIQRLEESMRFVNSLGIRGMLADFSPIPGTPDGDLCAEWVDMTEPLFHNKTAFPIIRLGFDQTNRLKDLQRKLNRNLTI